MQTRFPEKKIDRWKKNGLPHLKVQKIVLGNREITEEEKRSIQYHIFACGRDGHPWPDAVDMVNSLKNVDWDRYSLIKCCPYRMIENNPEAIDKVSRKYVSMGFEGVMLRNPAVAYDWKRSNNLLKSKPFEEADFTIIGFEPGEPGKRFENTLGSIIVEGDFGGAHIIGGVGSGFAEFVYAENGDKMEINLDWNGGDFQGGGPNGDKPTRDWVWANRENLIGQQLETVFQNVTDKINPNTGYFSIRFGTFGKLKLDR